MQTFRSKVYRLLDPEDRATPASSTINLLIIGVVISSVIAMALETDTTLASEFSGIFFAFELFAVGFFTAEYLLRIWSVIEGSQFRRRRDYLLSADSLIDLAAVLPFFIGFIYGMDLRIFIVLRLFRLFKLVRYFAPLAVMADVLRAEARAFVSAMLVMLVLVFVAATGIYFFEHEAQPGVLGSIPQAMWWSIVTLTTLGYGDIIPLTAGGRVFAGIMTIFAVGIVALPAGMLASRFSEELHKRKTEFTRLAISLGNDGVIDDDDENQLEIARQQLCLSKTDTLALLSSTVPVAGDRDAEFLKAKPPTTGPATPHHCPQCGHQL